jgi:hypothetical protein
VTWGGSEDDFADSAVNHLGFSETNPTLAYGDGRMVVVERDIDDVAESINNSFYLDGTHDVRPVVYPYLVKAKEALDNLKNSRECKVVSFYELHNNKIIQDICDYLVPGLIPEFRIKVLQNYRVEPVSRDLGPCIAHKNVQSVLLK